MLAEIGGVFSIKIASYRPSGTGVTSVWARWPCRPAVVPRWRPLPSAWTTILAGLIDRARVQAVTAAKVVQPFVRPSRRIQSQFALATLLFALARTILATLNKQRFLPFLIWKFSFLNFYLETFVSEFFIQSQNSFVIVLPPLKRTMAFKQAYSEWSTLRRAHFANSSLSFLTSSTSVSFLSGGKSFGIRADSSTGKFHCAAVSTNSSLQDSSSRIVWSL